MAENNYMSNPLVLWIETFKPPDSKALDYKDLYDGVFLNDVMQQIDQREAYGNVQRMVEDVSVRIVNWDILVKNIRAYYLEVLQQLLIWKLPNIQAICREPDKDSSFGEVRKTLLLILGCAVQCEHKETFVENIKCLDIHIQHAIVEHIKEITDDSEAVLVIDPTENLEAHTEKMFHHLTRVIKERDDQLELLQELSQERDYYMSQAEGNPVPAPTVSMSPEKHHAAVELAEIKTKLRHTRQELEDKLEVLTDLRDELDDTRAELAKVKIENADLMQEARTTRSLQDELDIFKEQASKVDTYEKEIIRYKERLNELEFYKARTEELREETQILEETRTMLEEQLATSRRRVETVVELENEMMKYREQIEKLTAEREWDREQIELLTEENARLEFEKKTSMNESASLEQELEDARAKVANMKGSLSDQLTETSNAKILRLELENQRLSSKLREMQEGAVIQSAEVNLQLEKENQRLMKRIEKLQESSQELSQKLLAAEEDQQKAEEECRQLHQALDVVRESSERQIQELEEEKAQLCSTIEILRERNEKTNDARTKELERENKRLTETINAKNTQLSKMEFESRQVQRSYNKLKENVDRISELETENGNLEKENSDLHQKMSTIQHTCEKLEHIEQEFSDLEVENRKLQKTAEALQSVAKRKEELEQENINLTVEKQKLERTLENLKGSSTKVAELESEKDLLNKEIQQVRKLLESQKNHKAKQEQLQFDLLDLDNENQRIQKTLEITTKRLQQLEKDNADIETENEQLQQQIEAFKISSKKLEDREKESKELEGELERAHKDKSALEKENRKLRQSLDVKETSLDEMRTKLRSLEHDHKALKKNLEQMQAAAARVKELEKENKDLFMEVNAEKKTVATLREELVKEKIHGQELHNELEKLNQELEHIGINRQKLAMAEQSEDESRLKALESLMQETLKKNTEIKDEKIQTLEIRLEESKKRNLKLQEELRASRHENEMIKEQFEEEVASQKHGQQERAGRAWERAHHLQVSSANPTKEILELKDHLVQLERTNATLLADSSNLEDRLMSVSDHCQKLEKQADSLQSHTTQLQGQNAVLQSRVAQLQVENTTLQSKYLSLASEKSDLQTQLTNLETEHDMLIQRQEDMSGRYKTLGHDHETLQDLHKQLSLEYEALISEHGSLKSIHKSLKSELKDVQEQLNVFLQGRDDVNKIRDILDKERQQLKMEQRSLGNLQMDYNRLRDDHDWLRNAYDRLTKDYSDSLASHKALKGELNAMQLRATEQMGEVAECKDQLASAVNEMQRCENKLDAMYQVNERLDNENQALLLQTQQLLNQNHDLLMQALNSKDHFAEEEKQYLEKLSELRRQKERLEEKIMEHYKNRLQSPKKNRGIGAMIARKARNIISRAPRRSKSRPDLTAINDSSSQGSDSLEAGNDSGRKAWTLDGRCTHCQDGPRLSQQNRILARSYSTLPLTDPLPGGSDAMSKLRGARSTENLSKNPALDDETDAGFRALSPAPLEARGERQQGRMSPGSEMLTLEQFLKEANKEAENSPSPKEARQSMGRRRSQDDSESRSSENSDHSSQRNTFQRLQAVIAQQQQHAPDLCRISSSHSEQQEGSHSRLGGDPNLSKLSKISSGSTAASDVSPQGSSGRVDLVTSTPKGNPMDYNRSSSEEPGRQADLDRFQDDQPNYAVPHMLSRTENHQPSGQELSRLTSASPHAASRSSGPEPQHSPPSLPQTALRQINNRELPPIPAERDKKKESFVPAGFERGIGQEGRFVDPNRRRSAIGEQTREPRQPMTRSHSVGPQGYPPLESGTQESAGWQGENECQFRDRRDERYRDNNNTSATGRHSLSSCAPRPNQRTVSALSQSSASPQQSSHPHHDSNNSSLALRRQSGIGEYEPHSTCAEPAVGNSSGPLLKRDGGDYSQESFLDRPKSVPLYLLGQVEAGNLNSSNAVPSVRHGKEVTNSYLDKQDRDLSSLESMDGSVNGHSASGTASMHVRQSSQSAASLPTRYAGLGTHASVFSPGGSSHGNMVSHSAAPGRSSNQNGPNPRGYQGSGSGGYQGSPRHDSPGDQPNVAYGRSVTPGPRYNFDPHRHDGSDADNPYSTPHRPQSSIGRPSYHGSQPSQLSAQQRLNARSIPPKPQQRQNVVNSPAGPQQRQNVVNSPAGPQQRQNVVNSPASPQQRQNAGYNPAGPQQRLNVGSNPPGPQQRLNIGSNPPGLQQRSNVGSNPPGPQQPYPAQSADSGSLDHNHRPLMDQHSYGNNSTPMARIQPQTKASSTPLGKGDLSANQRTAVGDEQPPDRPKQNSVWYEYGCV